MSANHPAIDAAAEQSGMLAVLRHRQFAKLWTGQTLSSIGDPLLPFALAFLVLQRGGGATDVAAIFAARAVASACALLLGGVLADRLPRKLVMIGADAVRVAAVGAVAILATSASVATLSVLVYVCGLAEAFFRPAHLALVPSLVPASQLQQAAALTSLSTRATQFAGPMLAAAIVAAASPRAALAVDAATFAASLLTLALLREPARAETARTARPGLLADIHEGFSAIVARRWIGIEVLAGAAQVALSLAPWLVLLPVLSNDSLGGTVSYAALLTAMAAGTVIGAVVGSRIRTRLPGMVACLCLLPFTLALAGLWIALPLPALIGLHFLAGVGTEIYGVLWVSSLQADVPSDVLGRVFSIDQLGAMTLLPLGMIAAGVISQAAGISVLFACAAIVNTGAALLPLLNSDVRRFRTTTPVPAHSPET